jgi:hypothetical protein
LCFSAETGNENPFRPDGELSKEADAIVERIKEGKPLTPTGAEFDEHDGSEVNNLTTEDEQAAACAAPDVLAESPQRRASPKKELASSPKGSSNNGNHKPTSVEVQRSVVGSPSQQVERVVIKKTKSKNKCCVIQ